MPANYVLLEKITVGAAGAASVTFSGIPQTGYTDLVVKMSVRSDGASANGWQNGALTFNGSSTGYAGKALFGRGDLSPVSIDNGITSIDFAFYTSDSGTTANTFASNEFYVLNYTSSSYKSVSSDIAEETNAARAILGFNAGLWSNTAAITSMTLTPTSGNFVANSTLYLYGVAKLGTTPAIVPYATGGDTIMTDGTYWYHTFISSGTFTPQKSLSCDYLVVAGGGGGGNSDAGGAGAGGLRSTVTATGGGGSLETALSLGTSAYTVTIGAGGAGGTRSAAGANGSNSVFATITSTGGGRGGGSDGANYSPNVGGSGGGAVAYVTASGAAGTTGQGFAGGDGTSGGGSGGGGGAGAVGGTGTYSVRGNGGNGVATSISGSSVTYAGGGGGGSSSSGTTAGTGGTGGGGAGGGRNTNGTDGTTNLGGGGGAGGDGSSATVGGNGGSGLVIVRYLV